MGRQRLRLGRVLGGVRGSRSRGGATIRPPPDRPAWRPRTTRQTAGAHPERADEVEVLYEFANRMTLESALLAIAPVYGVTPELAQQVVRATVGSRAEPYRRRDSSYRFENRFRYLIAVVS